MTPRKEPTLGELLADPMIRALMSADRVDPHALEAMLHSLAPRVASRRTPALAYRPQPLFDAASAMPIVLSAQATPMAKPPKEICGSVCLW